MNPSPYSELSPEQLILRDRLAADRTVLANERTFLAYIRTSLAFLLTGLGLFKFFAGPAMFALGVFFILCAFVTVVVGTARFRAVRGRYERLLAADFHK